MSSSSLYLNRTHENNNNTGSFLNSIMDEDNDSLNDAKLEAM